MNHSRCHGEAENDEGDDAGRTKSNRSPPTLPAIGSPRHRPRRSADGVSVPAPIRMRLLLNNNLSPRLVGVLVGMGWDAVHVRKPGLQAAHDEVVL
jgi:hypothetical protein